MIYVNRREGEPVFKSEHLIGSSESTLARPIALAGPAAGQKSLVLVADPAHADRPPGSDPLDIRDLLDWLEPMLTLDLEKLLAEVAVRLPRSVPAWQDWTAELASGAKLRLANHWDPSDPLRAGYRIECMTTGGPLMLGRHIQLGSHEQYLLLSVSRFADTTGPSHIEIRIDGNPVTDFDLPERRAQVLLEPRLMSLAAYQGREVFIQIVQTPATDKSWVDWRSLEFVEYSTPTPWIPLDVTQARSAGETILSTLADGSLFPAGRQADLDTYSVLAETELLGITAFRLEAIADSRFPAGGPGRATDGSFVLTDFRVSAAPRGKPESSAPLVLSSAAADYSNPDAPVLGAIDTNPQTGWRTSGEPGRSHYAVFTTDQDVGFAEGTMLSFRARPEGRSAAIAGSLPPVGHQRSAPRAGRATGQAAAD